MSRKKPLFLTLDLVLEIHAEMIRAYGGSDGIREPGLVESAVAQGQHVYNYGEADLFGIAAAYAFHLAESQAFLDGNKRTGAASALTFLQLNGIDISRLDSQIVYEMMILTGTRNLDRAGLADLLRNNLS